MDPSGVSRSTPPFHGMRGSSSCCIITNGVQTKCCAVESETDSPSVISRTDAWQDENQVVRRAMCLALRHVPDLFLDTTATAFRPGFRRLNIEVDVPITCNYDSNMNRTASTKDENESAPRKRENNGGAPSSAENWKGVIDEDPSTFLNAELVKGGTTNMLVRVWLRADPRIVCLVRFFGHNTSKWIDREREASILHLLSTRKMGKEVLSTFPGGTIESWIEGHPLTPSDLRCNARQIAASLASLHSVYLSPDDRAADHIALFNEDRSVQSTLWSSLRNFLKIFQEWRPVAAEESASIRCLKNDARRVLSLYDFNSIERVIQQMEKRAQELNSPIVLCHADLLAGNIIKRTDGTIRFIDFEYSAPMERAFDIANHFTEYGGFECEWSNCPSEAEQKEFLFHYLSYFNEQSLVHGTGMHSRGYMPMAADIESLYAEIQPFFAVSHMYWGLWALAQTINSNVDFNFGRYAYGRLSQVFAFRQER